VSLCFHFISDFSWFVKETVQNFEKRKQNEKLGGIFVFETENRKCFPTQKQTFRILIQSNYLC
jgi:hypothetical protein